MWTLWLATAAAVLGVSHPAAAALTGLPAGFQSRVMMHEASGPDPNLLPLQIVFLPDNRALFIHIGGKIYIGDPSRPGFPTELYMELPLCCEFVDISNGAHTTSVRHTVRAFPQLNHARPALCCRRRRKTKHQAAMS